MPDSQQKICPRPRPSILDIKVYVPGTRSLDQAIKTYKLSSNESPMPPSPAALKAYEGAQTKLSEYPDGESWNLRQAIGRLHNLAPQNIMIGAGSDELLSLLANTYLQPGDEAIYSEHSFSVYEINILGAGATPIKVKEHELKVDIDAILAAITDKTRIIYVTNPGNPTGTYLSAHEIAKLHSAIPPHIMLIIDGAYSEFADQADYSNSLELAQRFENIVVIHTFSKLYALAGLRVGWIYAPLHIIEAVNRIRGAFNVSISAQETALAAIEDQDYYNTIIAHNNGWRQRLCQEIGQIGLKVTPSQTNFILVHFDKEGPHNALAADAFLKQHGFIVRQVRNYGLDHSLRITIGSDEANQGIITTLKKFLET